MHRRSPLLRGIRRGQDSTRTVEDLELERDIRAVRGDQTEIDDRINGTQGYPIEIRRVSRSDGAGHTEERPARESLGRCRGAVRSMGLRDDDVGPSKEP